MGRASTAAFGAPYKTSAGKVRSGLVDDDGHVQVDILNSTLSVTQSGIWDINDVSGTISLPTGAATSVNQLADGHNVTVDNGSGGAAVNIQDGGNTITVDGAVTVSATDLDIRDLTSASDSVSVLQATHDSLNLNANIQVGDSDVAAGNPVPTNEVEPTGVNGGDVAVGTSEVEMTFSGTTQSLMIQSDPDNTGKVWVGNTGITNSGGNAFAQLEPGDAVSMDLNDASAAMYAISDTASQNVFKSALT